MNKDNFIRNINYSTAQFQTHIICPFCKQNFLEFNKANTNRIFTSKCESPDSDPSDEKFLISGILKCNNCDKGVTFLGKGTNDIFEGEFVNGEPTDIYGESLEYLAFSPPLELIEISSKIPFKIQKSIQESFSLYFLDMKACANRIRETIEEIMNDFNIPKKKKTKKNKMHNLVLHKRIDEFGLKQKHKEASKYLTAIKWIGNEGSHSGYFNKESIYAGYEMLEKALDLIYVKDNQKLIKVRDKILKTKRFSQIAER